MYGSLDYAMQLLEEPTAKQKIVTTQFLHSSVLQASMVH